MTPQPLLYPYGPSILSQGINVTGGEKFITKHPVEGPDRDRTLGSQSQLKGPDQSDWSVMHSIYIFTYLLACLLHLLQNVLVKCAEPDGRLFIHNSSRHLFFFFFSKKGC